MVFLREWAAARPQATWAAIFGREVKLRLIAGPSLPELQLGCVDGPWLFRGTIQYSHAGRHAARKKVAQDSKTEYQKRRYRSEE